MTNAETIVPPARRGPGLTSQVYRRRGQLRRLRPISMKTAPPTKRLPISNPAGSPMT